MSTEPIRLGQDDRLGQVETYLEEAAAARFGVRTRPLWSAPRSPATST